MATLLKFARHGPFITRCLLTSRKALPSACTISTTRKNKDVSVAGSGDTSLENTEEFKELKEHFGDTDATKMKNWISHGWSKHDRDLDQFTHNIVMFFFISVAMCWGAFMLAYFPDYKLRDWGTREAYLEMARRAKAGQPLIDPYLIPPETMELPSEDEIGDQPIII